ncbi:MAG TPA: ATP-binding protein, partial [Cyclobacteriaceae bacterium]|nr:ATP-binding protein [Cyclobacteriaceae bacterium]
EHDKVSKRYDKGHGLSSNYVLALEKDTLGNVYVGTHSGGMTIIRASGRIETFHIEQNDAGILIFNIHIDKRGKVWCVSNLGLLYFNGKTFEGITLGEEIRGAIYFDWLEDNSGAVWITSNIGVLKMKKTDVEKFINRQIPAVDFKLFDNRDGMKSKECTAATRALISSTGRVWVPTINGVAVFYPEKIIENRIPPPVFVTNLKADNQEVAGSPRVIEPGRLRYTFDYTAPSFIVPAKIQFKYKLDGVDNDWISAGTARQAEYTNLWPGDYVFRVLACNSDGVWNKKEATLTFKVKPFFYQTAAFFVFLTGIAAILLYSVYKWRVNEIERRNAELRKVNGELDRFVYSASHDLRAPLASVLGLVNVARLDQGKNLELYLRKIETSILKLDGFIRDIIDFSRNARVEIEVEPIIFESLIHEIIDNLMYLDEKDQIRRIVKVEGVGPFFSDRTRLSIVLNNLISNAIKYFNPYAKESFLEISVNYNQNQAVLRVRDNGIGILPEHITNIFKMFYRGDTRSRGSGIGLYIVKETLDKIKGKIQVHSEFGKGSTFTVFLDSLTAPLPRMTSATKSEPKDLFQDH